MSNSPSKRTAPMIYTRFTLDRSTPSLWRVTFNHPPINLIDSVMIGELGDLFAAVERNEGPAVLVFDSADRDYFLAHYDITPANRSLVDALPPGPTGFHPWIDILVRLGKLPAVQRLGCLVWSDGAGRSRSCSGAKTSMANSPNGTGMSTARFQTTSSKPSSTTSRAESRRSTVRRWRISSTSSIASPCRLTRSFPRKWLATTLRCRTTARRVHGTVMKVLVSPATPRRGFGNCRALGLMV